jgi:hypothetical protein
VAGRLRRYRGVTFICVQTDVQKDAPWLSGFRLPAWRSPLSRAGGTHESHLYRNIGLISAGCFAQDVCTIRSPHLLYSKWYLDIHLASHFPTAHAMERSMPT